jgi:hypothetical protein
MERVEQDVGCGKCFEAAGNNVRTRRERLAVLSRSLGGCLERVGLVHKGLLGRGEGCSGANGRPAEVTKVRCFLTELDSFGDEFALLCEQSG